MSKRLGILTGGGDVPGLNACIKAAVSQALDHGWRVFGIRKGWGGLLQYDASGDADQPDLVIELNRLMIRTVDRSGGTFLHTSRTNPAAVDQSLWPAAGRDEGFVEIGRDRRDYTAHVLKSIERLGLDVLIAIGGDDTLSFAARLDREGFPVVGIPKTMDNDVFGTDYCIGFSTAVTRSVDLITNLRTNAGSHERIAVIELFGRNSGETSLISAYLSAVDRAVISEVPFDVEKLTAMLVADREVNPSHYSVMTISEGAHMVGGQPLEYGEEDAYGHKKLGGIGLAVSGAIRKISGVHTIYQPLGYIMRSGSPDALDRMVSISFGNLAMELIRNREFGRMVALKEGRYTHVPASTPIQGVKRVDVAQLYDRDNYRPRIAGVLGKPMFLY